MMNAAKTFKVLLVCGLMVGVLTAVGCKQAAPPEKAAGSKGPPEVGFVAVKPEAVTLTTELTGRISAQMVSEVRPQVGGIIKKRLFEEGGRVKAGEVLYQIDPATYQAAVASAKAALLKAEANAFSLRKKAERYRQLVSIDAVSKQEYDDATAAINQAEADIENSKATLETAKINLAYTKVTAPIDGVIGRSSITPGALVTANQESALATIQQLDPVFVDVTQSSAEMLRLKKSLASGELKGGGQGQAQVRLVLEDGSAYPQEGILKFSEVSVDQTTGSVTLRAQFPNPEQLLLPGMFVRAIVREGVREQAMLVPQRGVSRNTAGVATALVVGADETVEPRTIKTERAIGDAWLVTGGLQAGDRVIVEGLQRIRPGVQVKATPFADKAAAAGSPAPAAKP
ncbi:MAG: efflux RND transporter periplasmic adaptor subunit [Desulfobulbus sp.]|jgi:membrane fusion protein (multidrug efflux system)|nr:efflux RND transporter periplasmic adaptor subunit [Desulfobulbus sp.]MDR2550363.1 efflux RND transporter periplasmic adaptor subunit [Desulfobulbus sp.]